MQDSLGDWLVRPFLGFLFVMFLSVGLFLWRLFKLFIEWIFQEERH